MAFQKEVSMTRKCHNLSEYFLPKTLIGGSVLDACLWLEPQWLIQGFSLVLTDSELRDLLLVSSQLVSLSLLFHCDETLH